KLTGALALVAAFFVSAVPARAELVFFSLGRTLSVKGHRVDGASLGLALRNGGEILCDPSVIARIAPDEVPYPEPEDVTSAVGLTTPELAGAGGDGVDPTRYAAIIDKVS